MAKGHPQSAQVERPDVHVHIEAFFGIIDAGMEFAPAGDEQSYKSAHAWLVYCAERGLLLAAGGFAHPRGPSRGRGWWCDVIFASNSTRMCLDLADSSHC